MSDLINVGVAWAFLKTDAGKRLLGPLADSLGSALGDLGGLYRYYQNENLGKVFRSWSIQRGERPGLLETDIQAVLALLPMAATQSDEELQDRWAALLERTVSEADVVLPSFGQILSQITAEEARFIERLQSVADKSFAGTQFFMCKPGQMSYAELLTVCDPSINGPIESLTMYFGDGYEPDPNAVSRAAVMIDDLLRLGIITTREVALSPNFAMDDDMETTTMGWYGLSIYGKAFIKAVTPKPCPI